MKWTCSPFEIINVFFNTVIWVMLKNNYRKKNIFLILINLKMKTWLISPCVLILWEFQVLLLEAKSLPTNLWGMLADFYSGEIVTVTVNEICD